MLETKPLKITEYKKEDQNEKITEERRKIMKMMIMLN
jgi:hypothetical protein